MKKSCQTCKYWHTTPERGFYGECRRRSPQVVNDKGESVFPRSRSESICGEYHEAPQAATHYFDSEEMDWKLAPAGMVANGHDRLSEEQWAEASAQYPQYRHLDVSAKPAQDG